MKKIILIAFSLLLLTLIGCDKEKKQTKQPTLQQLMADQMKQDDAKKLAAKKALKSNFKSKEQIQFEKNYLKEYLLWGKSNDSTREGEVKERNFIKFQKSLFGLEIKNWKCRTTADRKVTWQKNKDEIPLTSNMRFPNYGSGRCNQPNRSKINGEWVDADDDFDFELLLNIDEDVTFYDGDLIEFSGVLVRAKKEINTISAVIVVNSLKVIPVN